jgi:hypothetical protein
MPTEPESLAGLPGVLIQQFMLHEVTFHALPSGWPGRRPLVPVAHGLIDIYKCLHQGEFGVGHTIDHPDRFRQRLHREMDRTVLPDPVREPAVEDVSGDGAMLRINLRPLSYRHRADVTGAADVLTDVCVASARITRGRGERFLEALDRFRELNREGEIALAGHVFAFPADLVDTFLIEVRRLMQRIRDVPVFSHSETYRRLNRPSYRVVERAALLASPLASLLER